MILKQLIVGSMSVCCYLVGCEKTKSAAIIDPGGNEDMILSTVKKEGLKVQYIINTHSHPDHDCGNGKIKEATGAPIVLHEDEATFSARPDIKQYFSVLGLPASPPADKTVKDGEIITIGELEFTFFHTPGHTPGGMCLYRAPDLFTGDTLFVGSVGRTDFPGGDPKALIDSIKTKLLILPGETKIWPGHGYGGDYSTIDAEARSNPFLTGAF